jgi:photosystem II stability/assembly factor-like uncharacterized protein
MTAAVSPGVEVIMLGPNGDVVRGQPTGFTNEHVDRSKSGPEFNGPMRDARFIGDKVVAVGMSRQVYRREQPGKWVHIDQGVLAKPRDMVGFEAVDGFAQDDIYAAGLKGEIWHYDGKNWRQEKSPTDWAISRLRCVAPDMIYACGAGGALIRGQKGRFDLIQQKTTKDNLYGLEWFKGISPARQDNQDCRQPGEQ